MRQCPRTPCEARVAVSGADEMSERVSNRQQSFSSVRDATCTTQATSGRRNSPGKRRAPSTPPPELERRCPAWVSLLPCEYLERLLVDGGQGEQASARTLSLHIELGRIMALGDDY